MINLTDKAAEEAKRLMEKDNLNGWGIRLGVKGGGCSGLSYSMDFCEHKDDKDREFEFNGVKLFVDPKSYLYLNGLTLDFTNELIGGGFKFIHENAKQCSCGTSFSV